MKLINVSILFCLKIYSFCLDSNKESTSFSFKILEKTEIDLEELSEEAKEMETNDELSVLQNQDEDEFTQSTAFTKYLETEKLVFASLFAIVIM